MYCRQCGKPLPEDAIFCPGCGTPRADDVSAMPARTSSGTLNVTSLIWSIATLLVFFFPLGVLAVIFTVLAQETPKKEEETKYLRYAKNCNVAGTIVFGVLAVVGIVITILGLVTTLSVLSATVGFLQL